MDSTARFGLPLLVAGQGQKDITHNEALLLVDAMMGCLVERVDLAAPPEAPALGACWLIPADAADEWAGRTGQIAISTAGGWRFLTPPDGTTLFVRASAARLRRLGGSWVPDVGSGSPAAPVSNPVGGEVIDSEARAVLAAVLDRLRSTGLIAGL
jgi:hypothetical protein